MSRETMQSIPPHIGIEYCKSLAKDTPEMNPIILSTNVTTLSIAHSAMSVTGQCCKSLVTRSIPLGDCPCKRMHGPQISRRPILWANASILAQSEHKLKRTHHRFRILLSFMVDRQCDTSPPAFVVIQTFEPTDNTSFCETFHVVTPG